MKSRTKETGRAIGSSLGTVLDVVVLDPGVQWGNCLRVRMRINVTRHLVHGRKITIEGGKSKWVNFKYERLPNFCYKCGFLNHALKDCTEGQDQSQPTEDNQLQYGAWLRGEPVWHGGKELNKQGTGGAVGQHSWPTMGDKTKSSERVHTVKVSSGFGGSHVPEKPCQVDSNFSRSMVGLALHPCQKFFMRLERSKR